jgi:hypothetical protein
MGQEDDPPALPEVVVPTEPPAGLRRRRRRTAALALSGLLLAGLGAGWLARERLADRVIADQLAGLDLPATYEIESIGPSRQVLRNVVIGDPKRPDMTIERVEAVLTAGWNGPGIGRVVLVRPRLYGSLRGGRLSFGTLDPLLFGESKQPFRLPDLDLEIVGGGGLLEGDFGRLGMTLAGKGPLRDGFSGTVSALARDAAAGGCRAGRASLYGTIKVTGEKPRFAGPLRLSGLDCPEQGLRLADAEVQLAAIADQPLDGVEGEIGLRSGTLALGGSSLAGAAGSGRFAFRKGALTARYDLSGKGLAVAGAAAGRLRLEGSLRGLDGFARLESEGTAEGADLRLGSGLDTALAGAQAAGEGTLAAPLLGQLRTALRREGQGSRLAARYILRRAGETVSLVVPQGALRGGSGATLLALSRFQMTAAPGASPRLSGNFSTGGAGLPQIEGRLERRAGGDLVTRMTMAEYRAGDARLALPRLTVVQLAGGALGFSGEVRLAGALPGGRAENLSLPLEGNWSQAGGIALWRRCTTARFDSLVLASLTIDRHALTLCPRPGEAIVRSDARGTRIAAGAPALALSGRLGGTPVVIRSGPIGFAVPGVLVARDLDVRLGPPATDSHFRIANLDARIGDGRAGGSGITGRFAGSDIRLAAVPLDLLDASGNWRFADGRLVLTGGTFRLEDRQADDRFQPLLARDAELTLADNLITAEARLREPRSDREVVRTAIRHDLASGRGAADLAVDGIAFDDRLQPDTLTHLALGIIANAKGSVRGSGRIDWNPRDITSTGRFTTDSLDFAAVFGPVQGASGTIVFTDLLGLVTAPDQQLRIASVNPGIEATDGVLAYELQPGMVLAVKGASWPFLDGRLSLQPVRMRLGVAETRRYVLEIDGINAARFVERMELANLSATGTFDGALPLVFDENGGRIEGGMLFSRAPGGNVAYVGALTYKDLTPMANFAFDTLRSLDYREMTIGMDGSLQGEIVTRVKFYGVRQGTGAKRNFLVDRIGKLPIRFDVNVRAPFMQIASSFKSFYDPAYVRDPRELGLLDGNGRPVATPPAAPPLPPGALPPGALPPGALPPGVLPATPQPAKPQPANPQPGLPPAAQPQVVRPQDIQPPESGTLP